ncbi:hypothetical protein QBC47DRAFT_392988 [Echria macrotheca]|uniref:Uncharacterized protein n=1 Tax=Echria macrotheca TaxID=438768 RepID=A0AAJ0F797_9PEZI|nr:hypothetical protein QBC47DRAFT_392988 [Echria macrotheca]
MVVGVHRHQDDQVHLTTELNPRCRQETAQSSVQATYHSLHAIKTRNYTARHPNPAKPSQVTLHHPLPRLEPQDRQIQDIYLVHPSGHPVAKHRHGPNPRQAKSPLSAKPAHSRPVGIPPHPYLPINSSQTDRQTDRRHRLPPPKLQTAPDHQTQLQIQDTHLPARIGDRTRGGQFKLFLISNPLNDSSADYLVRGHRDDASRRRRLVVNLLGRRCTIPRHFLLSNGSSSTDFDGHVLSKIYPTHSLSP